MDIESLPLDERSDDEPFCILDQDRARDRHQERDLPRQQREREERDTRQPRSDPRHEFAHCHEKTEKRGGDTERPEHERSPCPHDAHHGQLRTHVIADPAPDLHDDGAQQWALRGRHRCQKQREERPPLHHQCAAERDDRDQIQDRRERPARKQHRLASERREPLARHRFQLQLDRREFRIGCAEFAPECPQPHQLLD